MGMGYNLLVITREELIRDVLRATYGERGEPYRLRSRCHKRSPFRIAWLRGGGWLSDLARTDGAVHLTCGKCARDVVTIYAPSRACGVSVSCPNCRPSKAPNLLVPQTRTTELSWVDVDLRNESLLFVCEVCGKVYEVVDLLADFEKKDRAALD
jgi:hypothetical protein